MTLNILSPTTSSSSATNKNKKKRRSSPSVNTFPSPSEESNQTVDVSPSASLLVPSLSIPPSRNPVTWNVNDVCWYLNQSGCSFALKTIQEQVKIC